VRVKPHQTTEQLIDAIVPNDAIYPKLQTTKLSPKWCNVPQTSNN